MINTDNRMHILFIRLINILNDKINLFRSLIDILQREKSAVIDSDLEYLNSVCIEKENLILQTRILEEQRAQVLDDLSVFFQKPPEKLTLSLLCQLIGDPESSGRLIECRSKLLKLSDCIREQNNKNRALLSNSLDFIKGSLSLLESLSNISPVYYKTGKMQTKDQSGRVLSDEI